MSASLSFWQNKQIDKDTESSIEGEKVLQEALILSPDRKLYLPRREDILINSQGSREIAMETV